MKNNLVVTVISCVTLFACKKNFLTIVPESQATSISFYKTTADITNSVTGAYAPLQSGNMYQDRFVTLMETRADNVEDINPGGNAGRDYNIDRFLATSDNVALNDAWRGLYNAIYRCNATLVHLDVVSNASLKTRYEGELRFLRALHYFNIVRLWGAAPLVLKPVSTDDTKKLIRNSVQEIYAAIESDLNTAIPLLPANYTTQADAGRATQGAAKALLGKVYLFQKKYAQTVALLKDMIPSEANTYKYRLLPNVGDVFSVNNKLNAEIIFAVHYDKTKPGQGHSLATYFNQPALDSKLLKAYEATDTRRDLLNTVTIDVNNKPVKKYYDVFDPNNTTLGNDYIILRYADVLLMYAEAFNETGYTGDINGDAFVYLNLVRTRANATKYSLTDLPDQNSFRAAVLNERRLEFPLELQRWFDLVRTNTAIDALKNSGLTSISIQPYQYLYAIPQPEIDIMNNPGSFSQNQGY